MATLTPIFDYVIYVQPLERIKLKKEIGTCIIFYRIFRTTFHLIRYSVFPTLSLMARIFSTSCY